MRILITEFAAVQHLPTDNPLCFEHRMTSWGRALAVLLRLHASPGRIELHEALVTQQAAEEIAYPDSCAPIWHQRASALLNLGPGGREFTPTAVRLLLQCARTESWNRAQHWLDTIGPNPRACLRIVR